MLQTHNNRNKTRRIYTEDQICALRSMHDFILSDRQFFRLSGYAGTGKTYVVNRLLREANEEGLAVVFAAPSNQAVKNFVNANEELSTDVLCVTVAQLLKMHPLFCETRGEEIFIPSPGGLVLETFDLIVIDEYSLLSSRDFDRLVDNVLGTMTQVIFVGDPAQIPPVKEEMPIVDYTDLIDRHSTMKEVVRHTGDILSATVKLRTGITLDWSDYKNDGSVETLPKRKWLRKMEDYYSDPKYILNTDYVKTLAWRNKAVNFYNEHIRDIYLGKEKSKEEFIPGDYLIVKKPVVRQVNIEGASKYRMPTKKAVVLATSEEVEVITVQAPKYFRISVGNVWHTLKYFELLVLSKSRDFLTTVAVPSFESKELIQELLKVLKEQATITMDWSKYKKLYYFFDHLDYSYSLTIHKSQGSTYDVVFIDVADIRKSRDRVKLLYTAFTRARKKVYLCLEGL